MVQILNPEQMISYSAPFTTVARLSCLTSKHWQNIFPTPPYLKFFLISQFHPSLVCSISYNSSLRMEFISLILSSYNLCTLIQIYTIQNHKQKSTSNKKKERKNALINPKLSRSLSDYNYVQFQAPG